MLKMYALSDFQVLTARASEDIPQPIQISMQDWLDKASSIVSAEPSVVIRFEKEEDAVLVGHDNDLEKIVRLVPPDSIVFSEKHSQRVRTLLKKMGMLIPLSDSTE